MIEKQKHTLTSEYPLMSALNFNAYDLEQNRAGHLSQYQRERMESRFQNSASIYSGLYGIGITVAFFVLMAFGARLIDFRQTGIWMGILLLVILGLRFFIRMLRQPLEDDLKQGVVTAVEGIVTLNISDGGGYSLIIGDQSFLLPQKTFLAFKNHEPYCVYYLPYSRTLVSAEWLR